MSLISRISEGFVEVAKDVNTLYYFNENTNFTNGVQGWSNHDGTPNAIFSMAETNGRPAGYSTTKAEVAIFSKKVYVLHPNRVYRLKASLCNVGTGVSVVYAGYSASRLSGGTGSGNSGRYYNVISNYSLPAGSDWNDFVSEPFTLEDVKNSRSNAGDSVGIRLQFILNYTGSGAGADARITDFELEDVTDKVNAVQSFKTVADFEAARNKPDNFLKQGTRFFIAGAPYVMDSSQTATDSALSMYNISGVARADGLENMYLSVNFTTQDDTTITISASQDGVHFTTINTAKLPGATSYALDGRDPSITYFAGWWWIFITGTSPGSHDFACYRSRDLNVWSKYQIAMAGGPYASNTTPMPGGSAPADAIWAPEPFIDNGVLYVMISIRYGADFTNIYGASQNHFKPYITKCTNPESTSAPQFTAPVAMNFGAADHSLGGASRIDPSVIKFNDRYYCAIKDSYYRRIQIYSKLATPVDSGTWTYHRTLSDPNREIEAPCLVHIRARTGINTEAVQHRFRVYVDHNRTGPGDPNPNNLVGQPFYFECNGVPSNAYGSIQKVYYDKPVRHGSIVNLAEFPVEATQHVAIAGASAGNPRVNLEREVRLDGGTQWIRPQPDMLYYSDVNSGVVNLTVRDGPADRFYLAVFAAVQSAGINVLTGGGINRGFILGFGKGNDQIIEMRRRKDGSYYPIGVVRKAVFAARKTSDQVVPVGTETVVTWEDLKANAGGSFNASTNRWTPPRGTVNMSVTARVVGMNTNQNTYLAIRKNGILVAQQYVTGTSSYIDSITVVLDNEECSGSDYFDVVLQGNGTADKTIGAPVRSTRWDAECW